MTHKLLPWFMQLAPNLISMPMQHNSAGVGRYTFMGDLNPFASEPGDDGPGRNAV
jgi:hypothetical protein